VDERVGIAEDADAEEAVHAEHVPVQFLDGIVALALRHHQKSVAIHRLIIFGPH
jgi:hypothetical protein